MSLGRLVEKWTSADYPPEAVDPTDLASVERRFAVRLPEDYRQAMLTIGLPLVNLALLDAIVERELDVHCPGDFYAPSSIIEETLAWHALDMPTRLIAFAGDGCGNKFCFDADRLRSGAADSMAVWFFDHDFDTVEVVAASFTGWMEALCAVEPWTESAAD